MTPILERLEARQLLSHDVLDFDNAKGWPVTGRSFARDKIVIYTRADLGNLLYSINGGPGQLLPGSGIIRIDTLGGDDVVSIEIPPDRATTVGFVIRGGDGNDTIFGGAGQERVYGGNGDDLIVTGGSRDTVYGEGSTTSSRAAAPRTSSAAATGSTSSAATTATTTSTATPPATA